MFVCSWTLVSALVPTLFLINATNQSIQPQGQPQPPLPALQDSSQPLQQAHSSLGCVPVKRTSHKSHRKQPQKTCHALQKPKYPSTSQVFCHSDLEGKCLCAHGRTFPHQCDKSTYSRMGNHNHPYLPCKTQANHFNKPILHLDVCQSREHHTRATESNHRKPAMHFRNQKNIQARLQVFCHSDLEGKCLCAHGRLSQLWCQHFSSSMTNQSIQPQGTNQSIQPQGPCTSETRKISKHVSSLLSLRFGGQVFVCSWTPHSGANTFPHQCDKSIHTAARATTTTPTCLARLKPTTSTSPFFTWMCASQENITQKPQKATTENLPCTSETRKISKHVSSLLSLRFGGQVFVCSWTLVSALVPTLFLINATNQSIQPLFPI